MLSYELIAIIIYFLGLLAVGLLSYRRHLTATDFIIGNRSMGYWLTAMAAHASDMSSWLFLGYPTVIFAGGIFNSWAAIGLIFFMFLNWQLIAPKIRIATERFNSLTFSSFFESRFADTSGMIRIFTAIMSLIFYTIYISAGLVGLGVLLENLLGLDYIWGVIIGIVIIMPYVFIGGYLTLAWIDLVQGIFLMGVILFVPLYILPHIGGWQAISNSLQIKNLSTSLLPHLSGKTMWDLLFMAFGWGIGYFGQPHIVTKFMGIKHVEEISKSKYIGTCWMTLAMGGATLVGLIAIPYFQNAQVAPEQLFFLMVKDFFHPLLIGFIFCGVIAATINATSSQVLVLTSSLTEDFYKKIFRKTASSRELLVVSRTSVVLVSLIAFGIAYGKISTIYSLVFYAWSGLGASFGPLLLLSLYSKSVNKYGAWAGIVTGGTIAAIWPYVNQFFTLEIPSLIPGFTLSFAAILIVSFLTRHKHSVPV